MVETALEETQRILGSQCNVTPQRVIRNLTLCQTNRGKPINEIYYPSRLIIFREPCERTLSMALPLMEAKTIITQKILFRLHVHRSITTITTSLISSYLLKRYLIIYVNSSRNSI